MKMDVYECEGNASLSSSSIGYLSADSSDDDSVSSNMMNQHEHDEDDASSLSTTPNGHMFELSDLMSQLPIKRGLSKYYNGKSDSFKNLTSVKSIDDVPKNISKRTSLYKMKKKFNKRRCVGHGLSDHNQSSGKQDKYYYTTPKSKISKSNNKGSKNASVLNPWTGRSTIIHV